MATTELKVKIDTAINAEPTLKALRDLKKLQRETVAGSEDYKKIQGRINDIGDAANTAKGQSEDWIDTLAGAGGPLGLLGQGLDKLTSSTNKFGLAFKAIGIGALVGLISQLVNAFTSNEKAMKKLEPVMIAFEQILGGIFAAVEPLFDIFVDLAMDALPVLTKTIQIFYSVLAGVFGLIKNVGTNAGKLLMGIFTLDVDMIKKGITGLGSVLSDGLDAGVAAYERFDAGTKEVTKTQKKNLEEAAAAHQKYLEQRKAQIEQEGKIREADLAKQRAIALDLTKTEEERLAIEKKFAEDSYNSKKKTLEETAKLYPKGSKEYKDFQAQLTALDAEYLAKKTEFRNKDLELAKKAFDEEVKAAQAANKRKLDDLTNTYSLQKELYGENSKEARMAQDEIFATQMKGLEDELKLYQSKKDLTKEELARIEEIKQAQENLTTAIQIEGSKRVKIDVETSLKAAEEKKKIQDTDFADRMKAAEMDLVLQQEILDSKIAADQKYYQDLLATENLTAEQRKKIEADYTASKKANAETQISIDQKKFDAQIKLLNAVSAAVSAAGDILGKNTVAGKALAVAASLINTYAAIAGQLKAFAGVPIPGYAIAQAIATGLIGFKAVADIVKTPVPTGGMSGGGSTGGSGSGTSVPKPRGLASGGLVSGPGGPMSDMIPAMLSNGESVINAKSTRMFAPLLSSINQIGGGKGFAQGGMAVNSFSSDQSLIDLQTAFMSQAPVVKTYVVSTDMTSQQMMDRSIKTRSTI